MFIGRENEIASLNRLYNQNKFQLFILYGRRRVGKTTLLNEFCKDKDAIFFAAEQTNNKLNLDKFSELVFAHYQENNLENFASWEKALMFINDKQSESPLILVIDEFPYLANINKELLSVLQHLIDHKLKAGKLFLILSGSYVGFMEREVLAAKSPLFGRRTAQLHLKPFDYFISRKFFTVYPEQDKMLIYGAFGGTPQYLQLVDESQSFESNIKNNFLDTVGYLYGETLFLLKQEVQEVGVYNAIIEAIAGGKSRANEIATTVGEETAKCLKYIKTLEQLGIVRREIPFGEKETSRHTIYRLQDFMFRFWYRYVAKNRTMLETNGQHIIWEKRIKPDYNTYMGLIFEDICRSYMIRKNTLGELPILFTDIGRYWGSDAKTKKQIEIDIVARDDNDYIFAECKWRNEPMEMSVLASLKKKADAMAGHRGKTWYMLFSKSGFSKALMALAQADDTIMLIDIAALESLTEF